ncbi:MjaI family restriction endonuclease [bacterium]|nr:MjaI family restriction endonuclease [bacterium]MBU1599617.1 MjaI family restriction endonuclease [bacterium]MBU2461500.1 MjaI family restriction endonuclease [bacterium]
MKVRLSNEEIRRYLDVKTQEFPKYTTQLLNLANQNAQGTRPKVVGQMTELIQHFTGKGLTEWEEWYLKQKPDAIKKATERILQMVKNLKNAIEKIDEKMVSEWVRDLVIVKTYIGLRFQEAILKKGAEIIGTDYRLSDFGEESKGIDGYIGNSAVSIKPDTYRVKASLSEEIAVKIIYYKKIKNGIEVDYGGIV